MGLCLVGIVQHVNTSNVFGDDAVDALSVLVAWWRFLKILDDWFTATVCVWTLADVNCPGSSHNLNVYILFYYSLLQHISGINNYFVKLIRLYFSTFFFFFHNSTDLPLIIALMHSVYTTILPLASVENSAWGHTHSASVKPSSQSLQTDTGSAGDFHQLKGIFFIFVSAQSCKNAQLDVWFNLVFNNKLIKLVPLYFVLFK